VPLPLQADGEDLGDVETRSSRPSAARLTCLSRVSAMSGAAGSC
jgi:hypothetical protein